MNTSMCLIHYGTKEHSGRYPYGSGDDPFQRIKRAGFSKNKKKKIIKKAQQEIREKSVTEMTDKEIQKRMARMKLEADYEKQRAARNAYDTPVSTPQPSPRASYYGKSLSDMSDDELRSFLSRLKLEQEVKQLTQPKAAPKNTWLSDTLKDAGKVAVKDFTTGVAKYGSEKLLNYIKDQDKAYQESKTPSWKGKTVGQMTDTELSKYINRMTNENTANKFRAKKSYKDKGRDTSLMSDLELEAYRDRLSTLEKVKASRAKTVPYSSYKYKSVNDMTNEELESYKNRTDLIYKINNPGKGGGNTRKKFTIKR